MKRHLNSLLLSEHAEFEGGHDAWRSARSNDSTTISAETADMQIKDGYDWLQQIKTAHPRRRWGAGR